MTHWHFEEKPEVTNPGEHLHITFARRDVNCAPPTEEEVGGVISQMKNGKCQGTDGIYAEQLKYNRSKNLLTMFTLLLTMNWITCQIPPSWLISHMYNVSC